ncbi:unnamed protein product [Kuraishia capsulata CBS 1993]|uniref:glucan 1,3-beta-glucosidase n=1 Tax=Kuraishia capsulata CBS 1993 TaxID=1382522 RepID=W6MX55_9ASCO|nr:uncharacterized protein KUCA_T00004282001 [Kuraishia capsulata CBS 1993]CDK28300.1 unnamed protein product [Kuraishia capsulata CBS 1993]
MVRIPIGYWAFEQLDEDPYVYGQEDYLDKAIEWSRNHGLKVWIDLHGAPGSQNGFDNSGLSNRIDWQKKEENINMTLSVLNYISTKYGGKEYLDVITGIEILNEPLGPRLSMKKLHDFYKDAYYTLRETTDNNLVYHDAFQAVGYWDYRLNGHIVAANNTYSDLVNLSASVANSNYERVVIDYHHYEVFGVGELKDNIAEHLSSVKGYGHAVAGTRHPAVIGEWSAALTDCAPWLNGVRRGARYDATYLNDEFIGSCEGISDFSTWNSSFKESVGKFIEAQLDAYNMISGWVFWCYKTENAIEWDLSKLIEHDLFPQPLDKRVYTSLSVSLHQRFSRSTMILQLLLVLTAVCVLQ